MAGDEETAITPRPAGPDTPTNLAPASASDKTAPVGAVAGEADDGQKDPLVGRHLDGYYIKKKLGAGGMGSVYLAHQLSLDREVALKVLPRKMAIHPDFVARFTREALSAAQLNHHNVVQVHDVGRVEDTHYISMEYVRGDNLGNLTRKGGRLTFEDAAGYVLQACRGLSYAHRRGVVHRDIKPDNLMVNEHGVVKVADLGLAKMRGEIERGVGLDFGGEDFLREQAYGDLTGLNTAMGTPAFMAPEQGRDASKADHRADQYSLGCTLFYLLAGRTPFTGKTSFEIISKHASEPLEPLESYVKNVPEELEMVVRKMMEKRPEDRYPSLKHVEDALEAYLGIEAQRGPYTPREHHVAQLEKDVADFHAVPQLGMRRAVLLGFAPVLGLLLVASSMIGSPFLAAAMLGLLVLTPLANMVLAGVMARDELFRRVRNVFFDMTFKGWMAVVFNGLLLGLVLFFFGLLVPWVVVAVVAIGLAAGYQVGLAGRIRAARREPVEHTQAMLKTLRVRGVSEDALMDFVCRYGGERWEEFFEALFGYDALLLQRSRWATREKTARPRKRFVIWRDPFIRWADEVEEARKRRREEAVLARAEKDRLKAEGVDESEAERQGDKLAKEAMDEGLLQETAILEGVPEREVAEEAAKDLNRAARRSAGGAGLMGWGGRLVRLAGAVAIFGAWAVANGWAPEGVPDFAENLVDRYAALGWGESFWGLVAGCVLLLTVASGRIVLPTVVLLGCVLLVGHELVFPLVGGAPMGGTPQTQALFGGGLCILGGFALMVMVKLGGGKF